MNGGGCSAWRILRSPAPGARRRCPTPAEDLTNEVSQRQAGGCPGGSVLLRRTPAGISATAIRDTLARQAAFVICCRCRATLYSRTNSISILNIETKIKLRRAPSKSQAQDITCSTRQTHLADSSAWCFAKGHLQPQTRALADNVRVNME